MEISHRNEFLLNIVALCVVLLVFTPLGAFFQISAIVIYDEVTVELFTNTSPLGIVNWIIEFFSKYFPAIAYIVSLGAAIVGFMLDRKIRHKVAITSFMAGGVMIVYGILMLINPLIPLIIVMILVIICLLIGWLTPDK